MLSKIEAFFDSLVLNLTPEMALAGGIPFPKENYNQKPSLALNKGGGFLGLGAAPSAPPAPPPPPIIKMPPPPPPPPPPSPAPTASSADVAAAQQQALQNNAGRFGYKASLLMGNQKEASTNTATGSGSLLGN
jgi:hypothetical protein